MTESDGAYARARQEALRELRATPLAAILQGSGAHAVDAAGVGGPGAGAGVATEGDSAVLHLAMLDRTFVVTYPGGDVRALDEGSVRFGEQLLTLHYLTRAAGDLPLDRPVRYGSLPGGAAYEGAFAGRSEQPLARALSEAPEDVVGALGKLEAEPERVGQTEGLWRVRVFPYLTLGLRLDRAAEGLPASATLLFPKRAGFLHHVEDLAVAGEILAERILTIAGCTPEGHPLY